MAALSMFFFYFSSIIEIFHCLNYNTNTNNDFLINFQPKMENQTVDYDLCMSLIGNTSEASGGKTGYEAIMEIITEMAKNRGDSWSSVSIEATTYVLQLTLMVAKMVVAVTRYLGLGVVNCLVLALVLYYGYKWLIKPYNYVQVCFGLIIAFLYYHNHMKSVVGN